jgi:hypothetical protein
MVPSDSSEYSLSAVSLFNVTKLKEDGFNWLTYRERIETAIGSKRLMRHLLGTAREPQPL